MSTKPKTLSEKILEIVSAPDFEEKCRDFREKYQRIEEDVMFDV